MGPCASRVCGCLEACFLVSGKGFRVTSYKKQRFAGRGFSKGESFFSLKREFVSHLILLAFVLVGVVACAGADIPLAKSTTGRDPTVAEVPDKDETVRGDTDPAIITLDLKTSLHEHRLTVTDDLPGNILIPTTNLKAVPITSALQAVLSGTDVSLSWDAGTLGSRLVTVINLSGPLPKVVDRICSAARVFCDFRHGSLELSDKETFVIGLPPIAHPVSSGGLASSSSGGSTLSAAPRHRFRFQPLGRPTRWSMPLTI